MKRHLGLSKTPVASPRPRSATQQVSVYSHETPNSSYSETDFLKKQLAEVQAQVATLGQTPSQKRLSGCSEKAELNTLRKVVEELRTQVATMKASMAQIPMTQRSQTCDDKLLNCKLRVLLKGVIATISERLLVPEFSRLRICLRQTQVEVLKGPNQ